MIVMNFKTITINALVFIISNLLSIRDSVDTQQLIFPIEIIKHTHYYKASDV